MSDTVSHWSVWNQWYCEVAILKTVTLFLFVVEVDWEKGDWLETQDNLEEEDLGGPDLDDCELNGKTWSDLVNILNILKQRGPEKSGVGVQKEERREGVFARTEQMKHSAAMTKGEGNEAAVLDILDVKKSSSEN